MSFQPDLSNVELEPCCITSIEKINKILAASKWLRKLIVPLGFLSCFVGPSVGSGLTTVFSIQQTNWEALAQAVINVPAFAKEEIRIIAADEFLKHISGNLNKFWRGTYDAFL